MENERDGARRGGHAGHQVLAFVTAAATIGVLVAAVVLPVAWFATGVTREVTSAVGIVPEDVDVRPLPQRSTRPGGWVSAGRTLRTDPV